MFGKKWLNNVKEKFSPFKKNAFLVKSKSGRRTKVEVARLNDHKFFSQRFSVYVSSKKNILQNMKLKKNQVKKILEITPIAMACTKSYRGQTVSLNAAKEIQKFIIKNKELLIDVLSHNINSKSKSSPNAIQFVNWMEKRIEESIKKPISPKKELDYNQGVVERVDNILFNKSLRGSKPIVLDRILLMTLADFEASYAKSILGNQYDYFVKKDKIAAKNAFGSGTEILI